MNKQFRGFIDSLSRPLWFRKDREDCEQYHVDFLVDCAIVKARESDKYDIDIPKEK